MFQQPRFNHAVVVSDRPTYKGRSHNNAIP